MSSNSKKLKLRDLSEADSLHEVVKKILDWSDRLALNVPRIEPLGAEVSVTDVDGNWGTSQYYSGGSPGYVDVDFSTDGAPSSAIGAIVNWQISFANTVNGQYQYDTGGTWATVSFPEPNTTQFTVLFQDGTSLARMRLSGAPGTITTNSMNVIAWIY